MLEWLSQLNIRWVLILVGLFLTSRVLLLRAGFLSRHLRLQAAEIAETFAVALVMVFLVLHQFVFQLFFIPSESMVPTLLVHDRILVNRFLYRFRPPQRQEIIVFHAPERASPDGKAFIKRLIALPGETVEVVPDQVMIDGRPLFPLINQDEETPGQPELALPVRRGGRVEVDGGRLLVDGACVMALAPSGQAHLSGRELYVNGDLVHTFSGEESPRPVALPAALRELGHGTGMAFYDADGASFLVLQGQKLTIRPGHVLIDGKPLEREQYVKQTPRYRMPPLRLGSDDYFVLGDNRNLSADSHVWGSLKAEAIVGRAWAMFWPLRRAGLVN